MHCSNFMKGCQQRNASHGKAITALQSEQCHTCNFIERVVLHEQNSHSVTWRVKWVFHGLTTLFLNKAVFYSTRFCDKSHSLVWQNCEIKSQMWFGLVWVEFNAPPDTTEVISEAVFTHSQSPDWYWQTKQYRKIQINKLNTNQKK